MEKSSVKYKVLYSKTAKKDIQKLDSVVKSKVGKKLLLYSQNPTQYAHPLSGKEDGDYRWRIGKIRVTFDLKNRTIDVLRIRYRREVYR